MVFLYLFFVLVPGTRALITIQRELHPCTQSDGDGESSHHVLDDCHRKLTVALKIQNIGETSRDEEYIIVDRVYDTLHHEEVMLYSPIVISLHQEQVALMYPFSHLMSVNGRSYELVANHRNTDGYTGCHAKGLYVAECMHGDDESDAINAQGFCCGCDGTSGNLPYHSRGGQDCSDINLSDHQRISAHCLRQDDLWYSVNSLGAHKLSHHVHLKVFQQQDQPNGTHTWVDLTPGGTMRLGTDHALQEGTGHQVAGTYTDVTTHTDYGRLPLDPYTHRLLIPEPTEVEEGEEEIDAVRGGPAEYLVVPQDMVDYSGTQCDKVGVSYSAFLAQPERCRQPAQSCLSNQPLNLWESDRDRQAKHLKLEYFLSSFGALSETSLVHKRNRDQEDDTYISFQFQSNHTSMIYLEINADRIVFLHKGSHGVVEEAIIRSDSENSEIRVLVSNPGLVSAEYTVQLSDCHPPIRAPELHSSVMEPQGAGHFVFTLQNPGVAGPLGNATCIVSLLNDRGRQIAERMIVFRPEDRCFCISHCQCKCASSGDLGCTLLSQQDYNLAGYRGNLRSSLQSAGFHYYAHHFTISEVAGIIFMLFVVLGCLKMVLGIEVWPRIGQLGLCLFQDSHLTRYYEAELKDCQVVHDAQGMAINPFNGEPARLMGTTREVILNVVFFFYLPLIPLHWLLLRCWRRCRAARCSGQRCPHNIKCTCPEGCRETGVCCWDCLKWPCCCKQVYKPVPKSETKGRHGLPRRRSLQEVLRDSDEETTVFERQPFSAPSSPNKSSRWFIMEQYRHRRDTARAIQNVLKGSPVAPVPSPRKKEQRPLPPPTVEEPVDTTLQDGDKKPEQKEVVRLEVVAVAESDPKQHSEAETPKESEPPTVDTGVAPAADKERNAKSAEIPITDQQATELQRLCQPGTYAYYNYTKPSSHIWGGMSHSTKPCLKMKSGDKFSLCGHLRLSGNVYRFTLGPELTQVYGNIDGVAKPLTTALPINPRYFQQALSSMKVLQNITLKPIYPCLNTVLD